MLYVKQHSLMGDQGESWAGVEGECPWSLSQGCLLNHQEDTEICEEAGEEWRGPFTGAVGCLSGVGLPRWIFGNSLSLPVGGAPSLLQPSYPHKDFLVRLPTSVSRLNYSLLILKVFGKCYRAPSRVLLSYCLFPGFFPTGWALTQFQDGWQVALFWRALTQAEQEGLG